MAGIVEPVYGAQYGDIARNALGVYGQIKGQQQQQQKLDRQKRLDTVQDRERFEKETSQLAASLRGKPVEEKINALQMRVDDLKARGIPSDDTERLLNAYKKGQEGKRGLETGLGSMQQAEQFSKQAAMIQEADDAVEQRYNLGIQKGYIKPPEQEKPQYRIATPEEKQAAGLPADVPYQISPKGQFVSLGKKGPETVVNVGGKIGTIPPGFAVREDKDTGEFVMYEIKGGPAAQKKAETETKKALFKEKTGQDADVVLKATRKLIGKLERESIFNPITGPLGGIAENFRGSEAADAEGLRETIGSGVAFKALQDMRNSNKTGGGLGAISEKELTLLKATMGAFNKEMSREAQLDALRELDKIYSKILKKARAYPEAEQFGFGAEAIPVSSNQAYARDQVNQPQMPDEVRQRYY